ncbi:MAG: hypothetical protein QF530_13085 [SAR202 cluster bacterium]|nr:hypothetical protein [SAR202 cluster bacterium]
MRQPGLVIWGESDGIIPSSYAHQFTTHMENTTAHIVSSAAHMVIDEQPDPVANLIESLLSN